MQLEIVIMAFVSYSCSTGKNHSYFRNSLYDHKRQVAVKASGSCIGLLAQNAVWPLAVAFLAVMPKCLRCE